MIKTLLELPGLQLLTPTVHRDDRGHFYESHSSKWFPDVTFVQDNHALSMHGVLRGLHYQRVTATCPGQAKLVRVVRGAIMDVAVDVRRDSPDRGKWVMVELSETNKKQLFIPVGFAHGYYVISDVAEVQYKCDNHYDRDNECGIMWDDPSLGIAWPSKRPTVSDRDRVNPSFAEYLRQ